MFGRTLVLLAVQRNTGYYEVLRPNTGYSLFDMPSEDLSQKVAPTHTCIHSAPTCQCRGAAKPALQHRVVEAGQAV